MKKLTALLLSLILCFSLLAPAANASTSGLSLEQTLAGNLKALSLFSGVSDTDFDLDRAPTKTEAVIMLIRLLGKESTVKDGSWSNSFSDVADWADGYVGYAHEQGLVNGVSDTEFGTGNATAQTFLTLVLRALGYSDLNGADFTYSNPYTLAASVGILPSIVDTSSFLRADAVIVMYAALNANIKNADGTLADKLIADGVFTQSQFESYYDTDAISVAVSGSGSSSTSSSTGTVLTAEEIYSKCSPSVFYIEVYNSAGKATASGSGFFIDSYGTAVTNYHVIDGAYSAKITTSDTKKTYDVTGVYDYSEAEDWAVLKINGSGFSYLSIGASSTIVGGATVYAIGSPLGLQNSITEGIISNTSREENKVNYIQTSAAISSGSSGGALINKYGEVIGVTSASYVDGQNLNLALPITYISAYTKASVTTLASLAGSSSSSPVSTSGDIFSQLKSYVKAYGAYSSSSDAYSLMFTYSNMLYYLVYSASDDSLTGLCYVYSGDSHGVAAIDFSSGTTADFAVSVYDPYYGTVEGDGSFTKSSYTSSTTLTLSDYTGSSSDKSDFIEVCSSCVNVILTCTEAVLEINDIPITIKDLGFSTFYDKLNK